MRKDESEITVDNPRCDHVTSHVAFVEVIKYNGITEHVDHLPNGKTPLTTVIQRSRSVSVQDPCYDSDNFVPNSYHVRLIPKAIQHKILSKETPLLTL